MSERRSARGPIPITAIVEYCHAYRLDPDTVKRIVWRVDRVLLDHWKAQDESAKRQAEADKGQRPSIGATK